MKKKIFTLLLLFTLSATALTACDSLEQLQDSFDDLATSAKELVGITDAENDAVNNLPTEGMRRYGRAKVEFASAERATTFAESNMNDMKTIADSKHLIFGEDTKLKDLGKDALHFFGIGDGSDYTQAKEAHAAAVKTQHDTSVRVMEERSKISEEEATEVDNILDKIIKKIKEALDKILNKKSDAADKIADKNKHGFFTKDTITVIIIIVVIIAILAVIVLIVKNIPRKSNRVMLPTEQNARVALPSTPPTTVTTASPVSNAPPAVNDMQSRNTHLQYTEAQVRDLCAQKGVDFNTIIQQCGSLDAAGAYLQFGRTDTAAW